VGRGREVPTNFARWRRADPSRPCAGSPRLVRGHRARVNIQPPQAQHLGIVRFVLRRPRWRATLSSMRGPGAPRCPRVSASPSARARPLKIPDPDPVVPSASAARCRDRACGKGASAQNAPARSHATPRLISAMISPSKGQIAALLADGGSASSVRCSSASESQKKVQTTCAPSVEARNGEWSEWDGPCRPARLASVASFARQRLIGITHHPEEFARDRCPSPVNGSGIGEGHQGPNGAPDRKACGPHRRSCAPPRIRRANNGQPGSGANVRQFQDGRRRSSCARPFNSLSAQRKRDSAIWSTHI